MEKYLWTVLLCLWLAGIAVALVWTVLQFVPGVRRKFKITDATFQTRSVVVRAREIHTVSISNGLGFVYLAVTVAFLCFSAYGSVRHGFQGFHWEAPMLIICFGAFGFGSFYGGIPTATLSIVTKHGTTAVRWLTLEQARIMLDAITGSIADIEGKETTDIRVTER